GQESTWEVLIALAAAALFSPTVGFGWVYDDQMEIVLNPLIRSLSNLTAIFTTTVWAGSGMETYLYRPLALVTYSLNHIVSGLAPWSYHLVNVLLHSGVSVLVFRLGRLWGLSAVAAGLGGLIFAVHPVHVEVVAAVFGRKDLLAGLFTLAMALLHGRAAEKGGWSMAFPVLAYACALLSKEVGVVGIALVAAQDWFLTTDRSGLAQDGRRANLYVGYLATLLVYVLVRNGITGGVGVPDTYYMDNPLVVTPFGIRFATAVAVIGKGFALQAFPATLSPDYSFDAVPVVRSFLDWRLLATLAVAAAGGWALFRARSGVWYLLTAWYLITVLPTANILVTVGTIFGERLLYLPSVAFSLAVGSGFAWMARRGGDPSDSPSVTGMGGRLRWMGAVVAAVWVGAVALRTLDYSGAWKNDIALFRRAVASVPNSTKANHKLGEELLRAGEIGPALPYLRRALEIAPDNEFAAATLERARRRVTQLYPTAEPDSPSTALPSDPEVLYVLGQVSRERGNFDEAEGLWKKVLELDPGHAPTRGDLGGLLLSQGDTTAALEQFQAAVRLDPSMARAWLGLSHIHLAAGRYPEARQALEAFLRAAGSHFPDQVRWARETLSRLPPG
ncbi:MAG: tetratricopeptide repeat protein, partial [Longimicrobiales bacterium]